MSLAQNGSQAHQRNHHFHPDLTAAEKQQLLGAMVAHELREPASAIQLFSRVMLQERLGPLTEEQRDFLDTLHQASRRLGRLINDLEVMLGSDNTFSIVCETFDLAERLKMCCRELTPRASEYDVGIVADITSESGVPIWADPMRIDQILLNLIENAVRYAAPDTDVRVRLRHTSRRVLCVVENVMDEPPGEDPSTWFQPFRRGTSEAAVRKPGLGLGLAVVDQLVRGHGGHVLVRTRCRRISIGFILPTQVQKSNIKVAA